MYSGSTVVDTSSMVAAAAAQYWSPLAAVAATQASTASSSDGMTTTRNISTTLPHHTNHHLSDISLANNNVKCFYDVNTPTSSLFYQASSTTQNYMKNMMGAAAVAQWAVSAGSETIPAST